MTTDNYYDTLGLAPFAEGPMVDQAYWHLAKTYQALVDADPRARQALDELNEAYAVLGTPRLREEYDAKLRPPSGRTKREHFAPHPEKQDRGWKLRLALPAWPFGKSEPGQDPVEARVRQLGPTPTEAARLEEPTDLPRMSRKPDVQDLHTSTARMLDRWRASAAASAKTAEAEEAIPDMTLVDIFKSEHEIEAQDDPLTAVMDILKAPKGAVPTAPEV